MTEGAPKADVLRALHAGPPILVLANAWDVASALLVERRGFAAVATTSAGVAWALGHPDGERIPAAEMLAAVGRIARALDVPVTADLEAGYGDPGATAAAAWAAGVVGLNLEDRLEPLELHAERVRAARAAAPAMVINARTDVFLRGQDDTGEAIARSNAYLRAGADCAFVPGVEDAETIEQLVREIEGPVGLLALTPAMPPVAELERLGVARVSTGPVLTRVALAALDGALEELSGAGTFGFAATGGAGRELDELLER